MMAPGEARNFTPSSRDGGTFEELRTGIASVANELKEIAEARGRGVQEQSEEGVETLRQAIRREPALAVGIALLAGAALAIVAVPSPGCRASSRWTDRRPSVPSVSRYDLVELADHIQRNVVQAANSVPFSSSLGRLADALTKLEPSSVGSAIEMFGGWLQQIRGGGKERNSTKPY